ncbi:MAG TPA: hypothetical protein VKN99_10260 [Polyangia bacterium]|nr:hypothetical protein [Polyangia bacterium]
MHKVVAGFAILALFAAAPAHAQKATFEDLSADAQKVSDLGEIAHPFVDRCDEGDDESRRQCDGVRTFLQHHLRSQRMMAEVEGAVDVRPFELRGRAIPVVLRGCVTCKAGGLEVAGRKVWIGVGPKAEVAKRTVSLGPEKVKEWQAQVAPHLRAQLIFGLNAKPVGGFGKDVHTLGVEVLGWRVYNRCTGEVLWSEPSSRDQGPLLKDDSCPRPEEPKAVPVVKAAPDTRPARLGRYEIEQALASAKPKVKACYDQYEVAGRADVILDIQGDGMLKAAHVKGTFEGTPTAKCVLQALDGVKFPSFKSALQTVEYPFYLR